jgi:hypothetical protein
MKQVSDKQDKKNREVARIKKTKPDFCAVCRQPCIGGDGMHLMNKQVFPQYYTEPLNIWKAHRECHRRYDDDRAFRSKQKHIITIVRGFATEQEINRYFG